LDDLYCISILDVGICDVVQENLMNLGRLVKQQILESIGCQLMLVLVILNVLRVDK
jgi:hypothetical protein